MQGISGSVGEMKIYFPEGKIASIENGKVISGKKSIQTISVEFEKSDSKYLNKTIKLKMEPRL